jgi:hypothetical protein
MTLPDSKNALDPKKKDEKKDEMKEQVAKVWNESEVTLLKKWGETAASYRLLHDRAYRANSTTAYRYTIPIIVLSTITGTASFSQTLFPVGYQPYVPMVIGGINIFVGILSTVSRFFRIDELTEAHRVASISYGKFARNIATELSLPPMNRKYNGTDLVEMCRTEMDRLIEQSPVIDMDILRDFQKNPLFEKIQKPEVLVIHPIEEYKLTKEEKVAEIVSHVVERLKQAKPEKTLVQQMAEKHGGGGPTPASYIHPTLPPHLRTPTVVDAIAMGGAGAKSIEEAQKEMRQIELADMAGKNIVSNAKARFTGLVGKVAKGATSTGETIMKEAKKVSTIVDTAGNDVLHRLEEMTKDEEKKKRLEELSGKVVEEAQQANISDILLQEGAEEGTDAGDINE